MGITVKIAENLSDPEINDFYNVFHKADRTPEEFRWEFSLCPSGKSPYVQAFEEDGKTVGAIAALPLMMTGPEGKEFLTGKPEDTMVDIFASLRNRRKDILGEMYNLLEKTCTKAGMKAFWGFTYETKTFKRLGFETKFHSLQGLFVLRPAMAYRVIAGLNKNNSAKDRRKIAALAVVSCILAGKILVISKRLPGRIVVNDLEGHQELLMDHLGSGKYYCLAQNENYLQWRLFENPNPVRYRTLSYLSPEGVREAEIIFSSGKESAFIEQIIYRRNTKKEVVLGLVKNVIRILEKENIALVRFMGFNVNPLNRAELELLKKAGFLFVNRGIPFVFKKIGEDGTDIRPEKIFLSRLFTQGNM